MSVRQQASAAAGDDSPFPSVALFEGVQLSLSDTGLALTDLRGFFNNGQPFDLLLPGECIALIKSGELRYLSISSDGSRVLLWSESRVGMLFNAGVLFGRPLEVMRAKDSHRLFESPPYLGSYLTYKDIVFGQDLCVEDIHFHPFSPEHVAVLVSGQGPQYFVQKLLLIDTSLDSDVVGRLDDEYEFVCPNAVSFKFRFGPSVEWLKYCVFVLVENDYGQSELLMICPVVPKRKRVTAGGAEHHEVILHAQDDQALWFEKLYYYMKFSCVSLRFSFADGVEDKSQKDSSSFPPLSDFNFLVIGGLPVLTTVSRTGIVQLAVLDFSQSDSDFDIDDEKKEDGDDEENEEEGDGEESEAIVVDKQPKNYWQSLSLLVVEVNSELRKLKRNNYSFKIVLDPTHSSNFFVFLDDYDHSNFHLVNCERWVARFSELSSNSGENSVTTESCKSSISLVPVEDRSLLLSKSIIEFCPFLGLVMIVPTSEDTSSYQVLDLGAIYSCDERQSMKSIKRAKRPSTTREFNEKVTALENILKKDVPAFPNDKSNDPTKIMVNYSKHIWDNYFMELQDRSRWVLETAISQEHRRKSVANRYKLAEELLRNLERDIGSKMQWFAHLTTRYHSQNKLINELVKHRWQNGASSEVLNNTISQLEKCNMELNKLSDKLKGLQDRLSSGQNGGLASSRPQEGAGGNGGPNKLFLAKSTKTFARAPVAVRSVQFTPSSK